LITKIAASLRGFGRCCIARKIILTKTRKIGLTIAVVLIGSAGILAYPNLQSSERFDEEYAAMKSLTQFFEAEQRFYSQHKKYATLAELIDAELVGKSFAVGARFNYRFDIELKNNGYEVFATPLKDWRTWNDRRLSFYINDQNIFTRNDRDGERANADNEPVP
jgi:hypothetical protein